MKTKTAFTQQEVLNNAMLLVIAHAVWLISSETKLYTVSWEKANFNISNSAGELGTITFSETELVGVFFNGHCDLNPLKNEDAAYNPESFFEDVPPDLKKLAQDGCLQYMLMDIGGRAMPVITAAIWSENSEICTNAAWPTSLANGVAVISGPLLSRSDKIRYIINEYNLNSEQVKLILEIHKLKLNKLWSTVILPGNIGDELRLLQNVENGLDRCIDYLKDINIFIH